MLILQSNTKHLKMRLLAILIFVFSLSVYAQESEIYTLINKYKQTDKELSQRLEKFANEGIERSLELGDLTPDKLIEAAKKYLGTPHKMGGTDTNGIDCSGLLLASFRDNGISVPHGSEAMAHYGKIIVNADSLKRGDLVFFIKTYNTSKLITHSGIYLGDGKFIHTSYKRGVVISDLGADYYKKHFIFGTRIFNQQETSKGKSQETPKSQPDKKQLKIDNKKINKVIMKDQVNKKGIGDKN